MSLEHRQKTFIRYLLGLAKDGKEDRGALADLRSGLGKKPSEMARVHKHVVPYLPRENYNDQCYYLIATLFGLYPKQKPGYPRTVERDGKKWTDYWSLGAAFRTLKDDSSSMEARFVALLNAHRDDLADHLRHAVGLLKTKEQPLDWFRLFEDLLQWDHRDGYVQLSWAQDFYSGVRKAGATTNRSDDQTTTQEEEHE